MFFENSREISENYFLTRNHQLNAALRSSTSHDENCRVAFRFRARCNLDLDGKHLFRKMLKSLCRILPRIASDLQYSRA